MADLRVIVGAVAICAAFSGVSHAAEKIALLCNDLETASLRSYSVSIDLEQKVMSVEIRGAREYIPVGAVTDNRIEFGTKDDYWEGSLDRITGEMHLKHRGAYPDKTSYSLRCRPAIGRNRSKPLWPRFRLSYFATRMDPCRAATALLVFTTRPPGRRRVTAA